MIVNSASEENLILLMEECAEVQQACAKILRFGWEENAESLLAEIGDVLAILERFEFRLPEKNYIRTAMMKKHEKLKQFAKFPMEI
jgi:NTP pyrophosphatase (non-canonical NTP hydrolase)